MRRLVVLGAVALLLCGCGVVTGFLRGVGIPLGPETDGAAKVVDEAIRGWIGSAFWPWAGGIATSEGLRGAVKGGKAIVRRRRAKRAAADDPVARMRENGGA